MFMMLSVFCSTKPLQAPGMFYNALKTLEFIYLRGIENALHYILCAFEVPMH